MPRVCSNLLLCKITGALSQYFQLSSFLWTTCFAHSLYRVVARRRRGLVSIPDGKRCARPGATHWGSDDTHSVRREKLQTLTYHAICWICPAVFTIVTYRAHVYGPTLIRTSR